MIRRIRRHRLALAFVGGVALVLGACSADRSGQGEPPPVAVSIATPVRQVFHTQVAAFGQLAADGRHAMSLNLPQAGQILAVEVVAGQRVKRGEPLLTLQTDPAARSAYLQARSAVSIARDDMVRVERLRTGKLATNAQVDAARKTLADAEAALAAQANLGGAEAVATLKAPADGVVTSLNVQRGERTQAGARLLEFAPRTALTAQLGVEPASASGLHAGMAVSLQPVYATQGAPPLGGTVALVGDSINPVTHLVDLVAALDAPVALPAGTAVSAHIDAAQFKAWAVPRVALQSDAQGSYVLQIEHGKARRVDVKVLAPDGSPVAVAGSIDPRAPVITLGSYEVSNGDAVTAAPAGSTRGGAAR
jgi:RND family efflux transporter MFP subunit